MILWGVMPPDFPDKPAASCLQGRRTKPLGNGYTVWVKGEENLRL